MFISKFNNSYLKNTIFCTYFISSGDVIIDLISGGGQEGKGDDRKGGTGEANWKQVTWVGSFVFGSLCFVSVPI